MRFAGLDVHKRVVQAVVLDESGQVVHRERFGCSPELLVSFAEKRLSREDAVVLEATTNTWDIVRVLEPHVGRVVVSNPLRTRAIAEAKVKTDKIDARVLAELLRVDFLPEVWRPDEKTRRLRQITSRRASLVQQRTAVKNRLHSVLHERMLHVPGDQLFSLGGQEWLRALELDSLDRAFVDSELRLLEALSREIDQLQGMLAQEGYADERVKLLLTIPGVDVGVAQALLAALGDVKRFRSADHAASYLGLVPSTRQSADRCYHGPITKRGRSQARWMLVQAAQHVGSHPGPLGAFSRKLAHKKNRNVAVVASARKILTIAWKMLVTNQPYRYALPATTERKLARLRITATGEKRKGGRPRAHLARPPTERGSGREPPRVSTRSMPQRTSLRWGRCPPASDAC